VLDENTIDLIRKTEHGTGASDAEIATAEATLGLVFVDDYREFLRRFGWMDAGGDNHYGLGADVPDHMDLVRRTRCEREQAEPHMPPHLLPLLNNGGGNHWCVDSAPGPNFGRIVYWDHEVGDDEPLEVVAPDYQSWLRERLHEALTT
jgi:cell wall assembly regulator SMI1